MDSRNKFELFKVPLPPVKIEPIQPVLPEIKPLRSDILQRQLEDRRRRDDMAYGMMSIAPR